MPLITVEGFRADPFASLPDEAPLPDSAVLVSLARFEAERDALIGRNAPLGVRLQSDEPPERLGGDVNRLCLVALEFPKFRDGRAFSWARQLRSRFGFWGEIRAVGDFLVDQIAYQRRVGFSAWEVAEGFTVEDLGRALCEIGNVYQPSADGRRTIRALRADGRNNYHPR
jgi:uncharacterized protein (DUF934 family)